MLSCARMWRSDTIYPTVNRRLRNMLNKLGAVLACGELLIVLFNSYWGFLAQYPSNISLAAFIWIIHVGHTEAKAAWRTAPLYTGIQWREYILSHQSMGKCTRVTGVFCSTGNGKQFYLHECKNWFVFDPPLWFSFQSNSIIFLRAFNISNNIRCLDVDQMHKTFP